MLTRRHFLAGLAAAFAFPARRVQAIGDTTTFGIGQLVLGESWNPRSDALARLAWEIDKRTSISVRLDPVHVDLNSAKLRDTPYLYLAGDREFALPKPEDVRRLRRFLGYGGFLHIDSAEGVVGGAFDRSARRLVSALYPERERELAVISKQHVVYRSFYLLDRAVGRIALAPAMEGVEHDGRLVIAYTENDLGGAWTRDDFGNFNYPCEPGGERQRELAFRLGVNLAMYALCLDYKADQVHVQHVMRRRRWRPEDGAEDLTK